MNVRERHSIPTDGIQINSLVWSEQRLIDHTTGSIFGLDGNVTNGGTHFGDKFDGAVTSDDGVFTVIYQRLGTKGVLLKNGRVSRELNRSYYCAEAYDYPITFLKLSGDEKWAIAHCPDAYNTIEIETAEGGERLTAAERPDLDFFQSRLEISPDEKWLLSAGWIWHPLDSIILYDLSKGFSDPKVLSPFWAGDLNGINLWEINNATFFEGNLLLSGTGDTEHEDASDEIAFVVYELRSMHPLSRCVLSEPTGALMPLDKDHVVTFYQYPKILNYRTGEIVHRWEDLATDEINSSIVWHHQNRSIVAKDTRNARFAVVSPNSIEIIAI